MLDLSGKGISQGKEGTKKVAQNYVHYYIPDGLQEDWRPSGVNCSNPTGKQLGYVWLWAEPPTSGMALNNTQDHSVEDLHPHPLFVSLWSGKHASFFKKMFTSPAYTPGYNICKESGHYGSIFYCINSCTFEFVHCILSSQTYFIILPSILFVSIMNSFLSFPHCWPELKLLSRLVSLLSTSP